MKIKKIDANGNEINITLSNEEIEKICYEHRRNTVKESLRRFYDSCSETERCDELVFNSIIDTVTDTVMKRISDSDELYETYNKIIDDVARHVCLKKLKRFLITKGYVNYLKDTVYAENEEEAMRIFDLRIDEGELTFNPEDRYNYKNTIKEITENDDDTSC